MIVTEKKDRLSLVAEHGKADMGLRFFKNKKVFSGNNQFPKILRHYRNRDLIVQEQARLIFFLNLIFIGCAILIIPATLLIRGFDLSVMIVEISLLLVMIVSFFLLIEGYSAWSAHILISFSMIAAWIDVLFNQNATILHLYAFTIVLALLPMVPLLLRDARYSIFLYGGANIILLLFFINSIYRKGIVSADDAIDFLIASGMAVVFITILGYFILLINKRSIDRAMDDLRKRENYEKEIKASEELFRSLIEFAPCILSLTELDGRFIIVNKAFIDSTGFKQEEIRGMIQPENPEAQGDKRGISFRQRIVEDGSLENVEIRMTVRGGRKLDLYVSGKLIQLADRKVILYAALDITERKKIEKELELYRNHLELLVQERTDELTTINEELRATNEELYDKELKLEKTLEELKNAQNQIVQSEKMASLGLLAAGVAHEVNNPLNFITSGINVLEGYIDENLQEHKSTVKPYLDAILVGAIRAAEIVASLNRFSRQTEKRNEPCNIHSILDNCLLILNNQTKHRIEIKKEYTERTINLFGNEGKLHQAFLNILVNSVQAIENKGEIEIETKIEGSAIQISVKDTGCGISEKDLPRIFDPFYTTKDPGKGTGLGLSITYSIIKEHKGSLQYFSQLGKGTRAVVTLPLES